MEINGRRAVIVGGASGMGAATATLLKQRGAQVTIVDRAGPQALEFAADLGAVFMPGDITDFENIEGVLREAGADMAGLDIAVNTAGGGKVEKTLGRRGPHNLQGFRKVVDLNLVATFNLNRIQAHVMSDNEPIDGERGVIVNTSSIAAFEGQIGQVAYAAAKAGIASMALVMARDLGSLGIRVTTIAPSLFATGATAAFSQEDVAPLVADAAFPKRMGRPEEYAFLAAAIVENQMLNGQCLRLDAGQRFAPR